MTRALLTAFLDIWLPQVCGGCGQPLPVGDKRRLCKECCAAIDFIHSPLCLCCGGGLNPDGGGADRFCGECLRRSPGFDRARSIVIYREPASTLLIKLKFQADTRAVVPIGWLIGQAPKIVCNHSYDFIMPVPLHPARLRGRGLNQALVIARLLFREHQKIVPKGLVRVKNSVAQTRLSGRKRRSNLSGAFAVNPRVDVADKKICIVDDVYTTGTTVSECAKSLKRAGARRVEVWTFARA